MATGLSGKLSYFCGGKEISLPAASGGSVGPTRGIVRAGRAPMTARLSALAADPAISVSAPETAAVIGFGTGDAAMDVIVTNTLVVEGSAAAQWLVKKHGAKIEKEGLHGKYLLRMPEEGAAGIRKAFDASKEAVRSRKAKVAHPNFIRTFRKPTVKAATAPRLWNHHNDGKPGLIGADVHAPGAWLFSKGAPEISVAVLDEGVDTLHPALKSVIRAQTDKVDGNAHARPDGDDAHGTACAGIIASQDTQVPGLAPNVGLLAVRIAKGDGAGGWITEDFMIADAIDWAWEQGADVLSNSWGGGPPVDLVINAIKRARTKGRGGKGAVVIAAAGNSQQKVEFPANLDGVLAVGASNQWDERKTKTSKDGENLWGSNFGDTLGLLAPGVMIATTDISGTRGYGNGDFVPDFNGTSAATPHVAASAALMLSVEPKLKEDRVRAILTGTAEFIPGQKARHDHFGHGRLNMYAAVRSSRRG